MNQIFINFLIIGLGPFLTGAVARLVCFKWRKGWTVSAVCVVLYALSFAAMKLIPNHGSELYGLLHMMAGFLMAGALFVELLLWRRRKDKKEKLSEKEN